MCGNGGVTDGGGGGGGCGSLFGLEKKAAAHRLRIPSLVRRLGQPNVADA